ncbi:putative pectate lyase 2 [Coffea eugenioides]|uniref:putative pectate lyase 2 n=1 Tax=Coffea eugenioides TaxID=49369 RepID=UPI000F6153BD|nr:putative pectate lyase 2 [Coffea eugenioides]
MAKSGAFFLAVSWTILIYGFFFEGLVYGFQPLQAQKIHSIPQNNTNSKTQTLNAIDSCWRSNPKWDSNRQALANCAKGFGSDALGGKNGRIYVVTDPSDDPINPKPGTLRFGAIQYEPLWIIFQRDMVLKLENELIMNSYKTIDGRGVKVEIANGPCITIQNVSHVIIHGISIHSCTVGKRGLVRSTPDHVGLRLGSDGDAITVFTSSHVWIDHNYLANCADGLVDVVSGSTSVTISNNYYTQHEEVMLFGHRDGNIEDQIMKVTVVFNHFGYGLVQRIPRVRVGYAHVANNFYEPWLFYAIGGSSNPTILSEGNYFIAPNRTDTKQVTRRDNAGGPNNWKNWNWRSLDDVFVNGAYFVQSGNGSCYPNYNGSQVFTVASGDLVPSLTSDAGPLKCYPGVAC